MKPIIGVVARNNKEKYFISREVLDAIRISGGIGIGIIPGSDYKKQLLLCDGIVLPGGNYIDDFNRQIVRYSKDNNLPTLGICLGMQTIGLECNGQLSEHKINQKIHNNKRVKSHEIIINKSSKLYGVLNKEKLFVNSRHHDNIIDTDLDIVAKSVDGVIEAIEDAKNDFFIGVQWHPESIMQTDESKKLFKYFISCCKAKKV